MANPNVQPFFSSTNQPANRGRKKGSKDRATILKKWLAVTTRTTNKLTGELEELTIQDQLALALVAKGLEGDVRALREISDTMFGKIPETRTSTGEVEVVFRWAGGPMMQPKELSEAVDGELLDNDDDSSD